MSYRCSCGEISKICFSAFKSGRRCYKCGRRKKFANGNPNWVDDPVQFKLNKEIRRKYKRLLHNCLSYLGVKKDTKTEKLLGYKPNNLRDAILKHPNWKEIKNEKWHLDHVFPIKAFLDYGIDDIKLINSLDNLQPLIAKDNLVKYCHYDKQKFSAWLKSKGVKSECI